MKIIITIACTILFGGLLAVVANLYEVLNTSSTILVFEGCLIAALGLLVVYGIVETIRFLKTGSE